MLDLDDTLYLERDFVRSGFVAVASAVADTGLTEETIFEFLWEGFLHGVRGNAFDRLIARWPRLGESFHRDALVDIYRTHTPSIQLSEPGFLEQAGHKFAALGLITDGPLATQRLKLQALGVVDFFDVVVMTGAWGPDFYKPHRRAFELIQAELGMSGTRLAYVGDNPGKDFGGPNVLGWETIRLRRRGQLHELLEAQGPLQVADREIESLIDLL